MSKLHTKTFRNKTWGNTIGKHACKPEIYFKAYTADQIAKIVIQAEAQGKTVRAVGSGHSFSDVSILKDGNYLIDVSPLSKVKLANTELLHQVHQAKPLVFVEGGTTVKKLNKALDKFEYSILNMGGINHQTIAGAISTGTHGTGLEVPAMSGMVRSIYLITSGGRKLLIEPTGGISNAQKAQANEFLLIQNSDIFYAALVSLGAMGIIYAYNLEVENMFWLEEKKTLTTWSNVRKLLQNKSIFKDARGVMVQINPYKGTNKKSLGQHTCLLITHTPISSDTKIGLFSSFRNFIGHAAANIPILRWVVYQVLLKRIQYKLIKIPKSLETSLKSQKNKSYINTAHKVFYQGAEYIKEKAYDCEVAFDLKDDNYLDVVDALITNAEQLKSSNHYHTSPIGLRFVKRSEALITPEYQRDVCYIDTPMLLLSKGEVEVLDACLQLMIIKGGIPHWGKYNKLLSDHLASLPTMHPGLHRWKEIVKDFNPNKTFNSVLMSRLNI